MFFLQKSIQGAVIILVIIVVRALFINKLPKRTFLFLWAAAVFCLLFPLSLKSKFSVYSLAKKEGTGIIETVWGGFPSGSPAVGQEREAPGEEAFTGKGSMAAQGNSAYYHGGFFEKYKEGTESVTGEEGISQKEDIWTHAGKETLMQTFSKSGLWMCLWMAGAVLCAGYFGIAYFKCSRIFAVSLPSL